ncbi:hypothetical protein KFZ70_03350 [Tamlana fucoidanivorans]|uniref:Uncharacterized protein n=1 Tax=Allotamlana fucoidanivorans TaxID=2583814 RepID=A0A5C4SKA9_9FLAO|nr:hypothetical protein [Tamlana fucoidanivorans]TNJ44269.1 hypothetical protein FGF67_09570 [Tamlana fucoidanivorans]
MIHKTTALCLVFILLANNINTLAIVGGFIINQDFIAKTLCVQKEDQKGCNGKCHLKKQLVKNNADTNSEAPAQNNKRTALDTFYVVSYHNVFKNVFNTTLTPKKPQLYTSIRITKAFLKVETPPPNFS